MGKSNFELWADWKQQEKLDETSTLKDAIDVIRTFTPTMSDVAIRGMKILVQRLFGVTGGEVDRLLDGHEYWIC